MIQSFTDNEYAVIYDSLVQTRERIKASTGYETPNIDSAIEKMCTWGSPAGCEFLAVTGEDAALLTAARAAKAGVVE